MQQTCVKMPPRKTNPKTGKGTKRRTIYIPESEWRQLCRVAMAECVSASQKIRQILKAQFNE
jgi:hypothetical protein